MIILPNYPAPKNVFKLMWDTMEGAEKSFANHSVWLLELMFSFLSMGIWGLASVFNFFISAIVVVLFFTIFTALKFVEFGISLVVSLCNGFWRGIENIFKSLSELYLSASEKIFLPVGLSPEKLRPTRSLVKGGPNKHNTSNKNDVRDELDIDSSYITRNKSGQMERLSDVKHELTTLCVKCVDGIVTGKINSLVDQRKSLGAHSKTITTVVKNISKHLDHGDVCTRLTKALWKETHGVLTKNDRTSHGLFRVFKIFYIGEVSKLTDARINNSDVSFKKQLGDIFPVEFKGSSEVRIALYAYMIASCFDAAYDHAQYKSLLADGGIFHHPNSKYHSSDDHSDTPEGSVGDAPGNGGFFG